MVKTVEAVVPDGGMLTLTFDLPEAVGEVVRVHVETAPEQPAPKPPTSFRDIFREADAYFAAHPEAIRSVEEIDMEIARNRGRGSDL